MANRLTLVLGGAASGKSAFAEALVLQSGTARIYIATAQALDDEMRAKIAAHRNQRGDNWQTVEAPLDAGPALSRVMPEQAVLFDCATMWLNNHLLAEHDIPAEVEGLIAALTECPGDVTVVSNEVGQGIVPDNALARYFRDAQGQLNQALAAAAQRVYFVTAGLPQLLKGEQR
ncbi:adenosylcobinamide kinase /adenosylcobinamide-phosphate guanylyltransferase [Salinihabitans flavidus]|uniref:Bifunctional adenosylcobalamin biosynthesis protein n=1 Tax=Salinihabitans flavidus TaxID=569882 RepID=A0A1H8LCE5_9RHOB|nr:bifunctional adenosylcobinamide kinase/adenosylcobinamide-phosphate guanylyltransferase [Salinihabitans flavidus]SEO02797.1 adenosylcobinamide kinase /adenosylcobinamide-phosphate guanylyltransferase [Salinihabitans flavidus]